MKNLVLSAVLAGGLTQLAGCIIVADDTTSTTGDMQVGWSLLSTNAAGQNIAGSCPGDTVVVHATRDGDSPYTSKLTCTDGSGPFLDLPASTYTVWIELTDTSGVTKFAQSAEQTVVVTENGISPVNFSLYSDRAFFAASWNLTRGGSATSCAAEAAGKVSILATVSGGADAFDDDSNPCAAGEGSNIAITALPVPTGRSYTVSIAALDNTGAAIGTAAPLTNKTLQIGNAALDLETVNIPMD